MSVSCPRCGRTELPEESRFCLACGAELAVAPREAAAPQAYTPEHLQRDVLPVASTRAGERKDVTVVLADVVGSLALAQSLDPEEMHEVMDGLFALALEAVHEEQGTINQFRGDGFMALFGAPRAHGEDALRALRASLRLRERLGGYARAVQARFGIPLELRMGVSTGTVWVGSIGSGVRMDYTAEGPTVGLAARLEHEARPGQILVDAETARRAQPFFALREIGERPLRGVAGPVRVFELLGHGPHEARLDAECAHGLTPFAGREPELAALERAWRRAAHGRLALVEVRGEAGIGKSRLVLEHRRRAGGAGLEVRCRESDAKRALAPWLPVLRDWPAGLPGGDAAARIARALSGELGAISTPVLDAVVELLRGASADASLCLVVEDAQWMDPTTRRLLERLVLEAADRPLLVVLTTRSELALGGAGALLEPLPLGPLAPEAGSAIAHAILGGLRGARELVELASQRAAGNPLFLEEICRTLRDAPPAARRVARLEARLSESSFRVPSTLHGVIAARIDALPDGHKRLLEAAAIALGPLTRALLAEVEPGPAHEIRARLDGLVAQGLLAEVDTGRWDVRHALVREVACAQVLRHRRGKLHGRWARALEKDAPGDGPAGHSRVGLHYDVAGEPLLAATHLGVAGEAYLLLNAHAEATAHLRRAWELLCGAPAADPEQRCAVGAALASSLNALDRSGEAAAILEALETDDLRTADRVRVGRIFVQSGWVAFSSRQEVARARGLLDRGIALLADLPEGRHESGTAHAYLSRVCHLDGDLDSAVASARRLVELSAAAGNRFGIAIGRAYEAGPLCDRGDVDAAVAAGEEAVALADELGNDFVIGLAGAFSARALAFRGDARRARALAERAIEAGERAGQRGAVHIATVALGLAHLVADEPSRASAAFERLAESDDWYSALDFRARGRLETGRLDESVALARACLERRPPRLVEARVLCTLGLALGLRDERARPEAERHLAASLSLCEEHGLRPLRAEAHAFLAELCGRRGEDERARYFRDRAVAGFEASGMRAHARRLRSAAG